MAYFLRMERLRTERCRDRRLPPPGACAIRIPARSLPKSSPPCSLLRNLGGVLHPPSSRLRVDATSARDRRRAQVHPTANAI